MTFEMTSDELNVLPDVRAALLDVFAKLAHPSRTLPHLVGTIPDQAFPMTLRHLQSGTILSDMFNTLPDVFQSFVTLSV